MTLADIRDVVLKHSGHDQGLFCSVTRRADLVMARQIFAWLAVNCGFGYEAVGAAMGEKAKHHSTVVHARRRVDDIIDGAAPAYGDFIMLAVRCAREIDTIIAKERKAFLSVDFKNWSYAIEKQTEGQRARERDCEGFLAARLGG